MGLAYLFALVVALGVLGVQVVLGARGGHHGDVGPGGHGAGHGHGTGQAHGADTEPGFWTLFLSLRFWLFFGLGFGLSGSLLHAFALAGPTATLAIAIGAGVASGLFAAMAFRVVRRGSTGTESRSSQAVGKLGRVVVACGRGLTGQVRVEIGGSSVDLVATTDDEAIPRGEDVLVEDVQGSIARVSRRPPELS
jgi:membrane protein implicated in regulation of membrane protease activity